MTLPRRPRRTSGYRRDRPGCGDEIFPELVARTSEDDLTVDYYGLIGPIIEGIKELDDRLRALEEASARPTDHSG